MDLWDLSNQWPVGQNDLEAPVFKTYKDIAKLRGLLKMNNAKLAMMSGSGPAFIGLFHDRESAECATQKLRRELDPEWRVFCVETM